MWQAYLLSVEPDFADSVPFCPPGAVNPGWPRKRYHECSPSKQATAERFCRLIGGDGTSRFGRRQWHSDGQLGPSCVFPQQRASEGLYALAHSPQAVAFRGGAAATVVLY